VSFAAAMESKILVIEDEADVLDMVVSNLRGAGFDVVATTDGPLGLDLAERERPALVVLDLMLPGMSGLEVCRTLKSDPALAGVPVIMLTAKAEEIDRIVGLEMGADDYITKPFSPRELVLRVRSVLRRASRGEAQAEVMEIGEIAIDRERHEVTVRGKLVELTATEFKLLALLVERRGRVQTREKLLNDVWGYESLIDTRTVDTHVRRLREKLGRAADCIETVRGFGYRVVGA
jgi:two-component system phosphate regulon response regulator PhoB